MNYLNLLLNEGIYIIPEKQNTPIENNPVILPPDLEVEEEIMFYGSNKKKILILTVEKNEKFLGDQDKSFLEKIIGAVGLTFADVALVNTYPLEKAIFEKINKKIDFTRLISFGIDLKKFFCSEQNISNYQLHTISDIEVLGAHSLSEIQADNIKKKALWGELQKMFAV